MPELHVLAIDPGEKAGWAHGVIDTERPNDLRIAGHSILPLWSLVNMLSRGRRLHISKFDVVIYETWRLSAAHAKDLIGSDMQTSQLIGIIRFLARQHNVKLVSQGPKDWHVGETVAPPNVKAILATLPKSHDESHDGPALCHLAKWWFTNYFDPTEAP